MRLADLKPPQPKTKPMSLRVEPKLIDDLKAIGEYTGIKYTAVAKQIVEFELDNLERELK